MILDDLGSKYFTLDKSIQILVILIGTILVNFIVRRFVKLPHLLETKRAKTLLSLIQSLVSIVIFILGLALILSVLDIDITPLLAGAGIVGIAVGFGSQALVKDLIAGLFLLAEDSIAVGDLVEIGKDRGIVKRISLRTIVLKDDTGALHIIPAGQITSVINLSREDAQVVMEIPFKPSASIEKVYKAIRDEIKLLSIDKRFEKMLLKKPELKGIETIEPGKVFVRIILYCKAPDQWRLKREFLFRLKKRFEKDDIELA
ncbi:mechanosensitive ion channel [Candidatus Gottesmanbacteria bacterium]|nr:mechanosensitive ion channel [Candidatus Gottesmanbacteria bacterium]